MQNVGFPMKQLRCLGKVGKKCCRFNCIGFTIKNFIKKSQKSGLENTLWAVWACRTNQICNAQSNYISSIVFAACLKKNLFWEHLEDLMQLSHLTASGNRFPEMSRDVRKPDFCICEKTQISFAVTAKLISAFVFATWIVQSLCFQNPKFQVSSHLLWLYSLVCVVPGRKPRRPVFWHRGSNISDAWEVSICSILDIIHVHFRKDYNMLLIMKTCPCNEHPLTPHFYIGKLGFTGVYIFFLFLL